MVFGDGPSGRVRRHNRRSSRLGYGQQLFTGVRPLDTAAGKKQRLFRAEESLGAFAPGINGGHNRRDGGHQKARHGSHIRLSFDPRDTPETANAKKRAHLQHWAVPETASGWHFLTGEEAEIRRVTSAAGFTFEWDDTTQQFAHVSGLLVATPDGRLSRYFYGVEYSPRDLRLALVDSSQGHLGTVVEELLLYCFHYDPSSGRYGAVFMNIMRLGGVLTVGLVAGFIVLMRWRESRQVAERHA